jgi:hypothetical protein
MRRTRWNEGWEVRPKADRFAELTGGAAPWAPVTLPHDAMLATERREDAGPANGYFPAGRWEYRRTFDRPAAEIVVLELEAAYRDAVVAVNGSIVAHHPNGYTGFTVPLHHLLVDGENELTVEVSAGADSRWYSGAGLIRDVWLLVAGPVHLVPDTLVVQTPEVDDDLAVVTVAVDVANLGTTTVVVPVVVDLGDVSASTPITVFPGDTVTACQRLHVERPRRWRLDDPQLHECTVRLGEVDEDRTTFGIRTLSVDAERGLRINGEPVKLRGACVHHDNGPLGAAAIGRAEERRVELLHTAGFNALRSAHNPMSRAMLDACDRLGVVVMDETFDMWAQTKSADDYALRFDDWWERDVEAMVRKDRNHPSVVMYSIGNEITDAMTATGLQRSRAMAERLRELDPTRYVTQAINGLFAAGMEMFERLPEVMSQSVEETTGVNTMMNRLGDFLDQAMVSPAVTERTEESCAQLDIAGYNYMWSRFDGDRERFPHRVIVASETHPATMDRGWAAVERNPHVIGDFTWTGWDYLGEAGIGRTVYGDEPVGAEAFHGSYPWVAAWCGDLDLTGRRRAQSYYREIVFGLRTDPWIGVQVHPGEAVAYAGSWSWSALVEDWSGIEGQSAVVEVYADADEVELLVNGESVGRQAVDRLRAEFEVTFEPGEVEAVAWRGDEEVGRSTLRSERLDDLRVDRASITADTTDLAYVEILTTEDRPVTVEVEGPGVLAGVASARPDTTEPFTGDTVTTFDGRAIAVVRPTGPGTITVRCDGRELSIEAT